MNLRHLRWMPLLLLGILAAGCGDTINGKSLAEPKVAEFHALLKARDFAALYRSTARDFRNAIAEDKATALFAAIDRKLGPPGEATLINWRVNTHNFTTTAVLVYSTKYRDDTATETFTIRIANGKPELVGYNIASLEMLIK